MAFVVKSRFYANDDNLGESYIIQSDNGHVNLNLESGSKVFLLLNTDSIVQQIWESAEADGGKR